MFKAQSSKFIMHLQKYVITHTKSEVFSIFFDFSVQVSLLFSFIRQKLIYHLSLII